MPLYYKNNGNWTEFNPNPYPVGTLVMNKDVDTSPAALVGGTWEKWDNTVESNYTLYYSQSSITNFQLDSTGYCSGKFKISSQFTIYLSSQEVVYAPLGKDFFLPASFNESGYATISDAIIDIPRYTVYLCIDNQGILSFKMSSQYPTYSVTIPPMTIDFGYYTSLANPFGDFYNYKRTA